MSLEIGEADVASELDDLLGCGRVCLSCVPASAPFSKCDECIRSEVIGQPPPSHLAYLEDNRSWTDGESGSKMFLRTHATHAWG